MLFVCVLCVCLQACSCVYSWCKVCGSHKAGMQHAVCRTHAVCVVKGVRDSCCEAQRSSLLSPGGLWSDNSYLSTLFSFFLLTSFSYLLPPLCCLPILNSKKHAHYRYITLELAGEKMIIQVLKYCKVYCNMTNNTLTLMCITQNCLGLTIRHLDSE